MKKLRYHSATLKDNRLVPQHLVMLVLNRWGRYERYRFVRPLDRRQGADQRMCQQLVDPRDGNNFQAAFYVIRNFRQILFIFLRNKHGRDAAA